MDNFDYAAAYIAAITRSDGANTPVSFRCIHDTNREVAAHSFDGTLAQHWQTFLQYQNAGYGVFVNINELDGQGRDIANVCAMRTHVVDLDGIDAVQQYQSTSTWQPAPTFAVTSSEDRYHVYWVLQERYADPVRYSALQRRLRQTFNGDKSVIDPTRVLRLPGTYNLKRETPFLVTCHALSGFSQPVTVDVLERALQHVVLLDTGGGERHDLGDPSLAAPSLAWVKRAMELVDPNELDRAEWLGLSAAIKQAAWTLTDPESLYLLWSEWCARFHKNDVGENAKLWQSIRSTELGWHSLVRRVPSLKAAVAFGEAASAPLAPLPSPVQAAQIVEVHVPPMPEPQPLDCSGEFLSHLECESWFKGCVFVGSFAKIMLPNGKMYNSTQFNGSEYAGKKFIISSDGKVTDEPWKAATRSTLWRVTKVDHLRFLPEQPAGAIVTDVLGRKGVNTYIRPNIVMEQGDVTPFLNHIAAIIPDENDRRILLDWMAHVVRYPGFKIPWAPVIQSVEGIGKGVIKQAMTYAIGLPYVHFPDAQQLGDSGGKFNAWMRNKVFILADEIKVDEKRHLVEVLKPLISESLIEIQGKGIDQEMEDNPANWAFFTNWKDAVPVSKNGRRYAIFYSPIQTEEHLFALGMDDTYMKALFAWLQSGGQRYIAHWLHTYPIERGSIAMRAPRTTSWDEAVSISRSPIERCITEAITAGAPGFNGGWVSEIAAIKRIRDLNVVRGNVPPHAIRSVLESMGYNETGRQMRPYFQEDKDATGVLYSLGGKGDPAQYGVAQGYE